MRGPRDVLLSGSIDDLLSGPLLCVGLLISYCVGRLMLDVLLSGPRDVLLSGSHDVMFIECIDVLSSGLHCVGQLRAVLLNLYGGVYVATLGNP